MTRKPIALVGDQDTLEERLAALDQLFDSGAMKVDKVQQIQLKRGPKFTPPKKKRK